MVLRKMWIGYKPLQRSPSIEKISLSTLPIHGQGSVDKISTLPRHGQGSVDLQKWSNYEGEKKFFNLLMTILSPPY
jgi:hypothetical protein